MVTRPKKISELICSQFDLPNPMKMYKTVLRPSKTTKVKSKLDIKTFGPKSRVGHWLSQVKKSDLFKAYI